MRRLFALLLVVSLVILVLPARLQANSQADGDYQFFEITKHNVKGEFLRFYRAAPNPTLLYGYPITEEMPGKDGLQRVQYFQRARFEYHPELPPGQQVVLTSLGSKTYKAGTPITVNPNLGCRRFDNGFAVCFAFLEFYDKYGGEKQFGKPISFFEIQDNIIVQYFEKARFEWQPNKPEGQRVVITDLGRVYFSQLGEDPAALAPVLPLDGRPIGVYALRVNTFCWKAVTLASDQQLIYITVQDQTLQPVPRATVTVKVYWPTGIQKFEGLSTNNNGVVIVPLTFSNQPYGQVIQVEVEVEYGSLKVSSGTSFRIWY